MIEDGEDPYGDFAPKAAAAGLRARADRLSGADRDYLLWLAEEWEKTAGRLGDPNRMTPPAIRHRR